MGGLRASPMLPDQIEMLYQDTFNGWPPRAAVSGERAIEGRAPTAGRLVGCVRADAAPAGRWR